MKRWIVMVLCILLLSACSNAKEKSVVCTMNSNEGLEAKTEYFYNEKNEMTKMIETNTLTLTEEELEMYSFKEYEEEVHSLYKDKQSAKGVEIAFSNNEKAKQIIIKVSIDFSKYDFVLDVFSLGEEETFSDIHTYIDTINAYHISTCEEVK